MRRALWGSMRAAASGSAARARRTQPRRRPARAVHASSSRPQREVLAREAQIVDDCLHVEAGAADEQRPSSPRLDVGDRGACLSLEPRRPTSRRPGRRRRSGGAELVHVLGPSASPSRCRARGTPASSRRETISTSPKRVGERKRERRLARRGGTDEGEVRGRQAAATGMRTRRRVRLRRRPDLTGEPVRGRVR